MSNTKNTDISLQGRSLNFTSKLYVWSVVLESLLFFVVVDSSVSIIGGNISRVFQFFVLILILLRTLLSPISRLSVFNPFSDYFKWYLIYFFFTVISLVYGYFSGAYIGKSVSFSSTVFRPGFEYFISIYYFIYFVVLPIFLLNSKKGIDYFFRIFFFMFFISFALGSIDFLLAFLLNIEFIPRHISDFRHVGSRFHGLAGEPRDAFVHLVFGLCLLYLHEMWSGERFRRIWILLIGVAAILTQSASGIIGLFIAIFLITLFNLPKMKFKSIIYLIIVSSLIIGGLTYFANNNPRLLLYIEAAPDALRALERGLELPYVIQVQVANIYPIWVRWLQLIDFNILPFFIGTGLGTASIINSYIINEVAVLNPHANIIRVGYESGLIGGLLFIAAFMIPIRRIEKLYNVNHLGILMLLMLGVTFGHRSSAIFTFLGISLLVFLSRRVDSQKKE